MKQNLYYEQSITVQPSQTAVALGSGSLDVFATPAMIALMENTALKACVSLLQTGQTTVGVDICAKHLLPSVVGEIVTCKTFVTSIDGRKISFDITVSNLNGNIIGKATHERFIVDADKFMNKALNAANLK